MIIWINGAFGAGKSTIAEELHLRIPDSYIFDPESTGYFLREVLPKELQTADFQDLYLWREFNYKILSYLARSHKGTVIVPMTLVHPEYWDSIVGELKQEGINVKHFTLAAAKPTLLKRLESRGEGEHSWPAAQIDRCLEALSNEIFEQIIETDDLTPEEITNIILESIL